MSFITAALTGAGGSSRGNLSPDVLKRLRAGETVDGMRMGRGNYNGPQITPNDDGSGNPENFEQVIYGNSGKHGQTNTWDTWNLDGTYRGSGSGDSDLLSGLKFGATALGGYYGVNALGGAGGLTGAVPAGNGAFLGAETAVGGGLGGAGAAGLTAAPSIAAAGGATGAGAGLGQFGTAALINAGGSLASGLIGANASGKAVDAQVDAARTASDAQLTGVRESNALLKQIYNEGVQRQQPFYDAGITSQNKLMDLLGLSNRQGAEGYGSLNQNFGMSDFQADPGYGFRMSEGLKALDRQAAARGGLISGGALKAAERYGQNLASDEYSNAFNRYQTNRMNRLNPLQGFLGQGQSAATQLNSAGSNYANNASANINNGANAVANGITNAANARSSGYIGGANALTGALSGLGNSYMQYSMMNNLFGGGKSPSLGGGSVPWIPDIGP